MNGRIIIILLAAVCGTQAGVFHFPNHEFDMTPLGTAIDQASMKLLKEVYQSADNKNVVASPLGVMVLLSLYGSGAGDSIREEIMQLLGSANYTELSKSFSGLNARFAAMDASYLKLANRVYVSDQYTINDEFSQTAVQSYHSNVEKANFKDPEAAVAVINKWAEEETKGNIKDAVSKDAIDPDTAAALFNVIFFQGHWSVPFKANETLDKDFHVDKTTTVKKPTMQLLKCLFYHEDNELGARLLELPYKEPGFRMVVVLPNEIDGLPAVLEKVAEKGLLKDVFALNPTRTEVHLEIPKFEINSNLNLNDLLPKVGVSNIFRLGAAGIVKEREVKVSTAFQKAFVKVDEEGATAGAFTGMILMPMSSAYTVPPPIEFKVDHPFMFLILHEDIVLFTGTYTN